MCWLVLRSLETNDLVGAAEVITCLPFAILCHPLFEGMAVKVPSWEQGLGARRTQNLVLPWLSSFQTHNYPACAMKQTRNRSQTPAAALQNSHVTNQVPLLPTVRT